jgi:hypothetical protein
LGDLGVVAGEEDLGDLHVAEDLGTGVVGVFEQAVAEGVVPGGLLVAEEGVFSSADTPAHSSRSALWHKTPTCVKGLLLHVDLPRLGNQNSIPNEWCLRRPQRRRQEVTMGACCKLDLFRGVS